MGSVRIDVAIRPSKPDERGFVVRSLVDSLLGARDHGEDASERWVRLGGGRKLRPHAMRIAIGDYVARLLERDGARALVAVELESSEQLGFSLWQPHHGAATAWLHYVYVRRGVDSEPVRRLGVGLELVRAAEAAAGCPLRPTCWTEDGAALWRAYQAHSDARGAA
jgi:hypothetical protein